MGKRVARVTFTPNTNFDNKRTRMRKRCLAKLLAQPAICDAPPDRLEQEVRRHKATYSATSKQERLQHDACRVAVMAIALAKRRGVFGKLRATPLEQLRADLLC